jgi:putative Ca2+/H+ antiporter (TMEM165/GDT1 family)
VHALPVDTGSSGTLSHSVGSTLKDTLPYTEGKPAAAILGEATDGIIQPFHSFVLSFTMIIFSEIGDKTFLVAALMAMRHPQLVVFSGAFSALIAMTILSAVLGHAVPTLLPKHLTAWLAAGLFLIFGAKLMREGLAMSKDAGVGEEMQEVEAELEEKEHQARKEGRRRSSISPYVLEAGRGRRSGSRSAPKLATRAQSPPSSDSSRSPSPSGRGAKASVSNALGGLHNLLGLLLSPAWVQTFIMTFLGEWGDRSQIATIAMAAGQDYWWVTGGAITGHMICTGIAVIGGRALAGKVSLRVGE